jgi:bis(5'-nucleosyl)-tetraphosphatase (symmetrical)
LGMALYMIGDVQGCNTALQHLLRKVDFSPSRDTAYLLGDLVNRGPESLAVLRWAMAGAASVRCILGNHDLHLLGVAHGVRKQGRKDTLGPILEASDASVLLQWLRQQPLARLEHGWLMVHAGVLPQWTAAQTVALSQEVSAAIAGSDHESFWELMYGNQPDRWTDSLAGADRLRVVVNALTRLRFCTAEGQMEFDSKDELGTQPAGYLPWFDVPYRQTAEQPVAFGHWSTLQGLQRPGLLALDTGCVWGGCLTAAHFQPAGLDGQPIPPECIAVRCDAAQKPGKDKKSNKALNRP